MYNRACRVYMNLIPQTVTHITGGGVSLNEILLYIMTFKREKKLIRTCMCVILLSWRRYVLGDNGVSPKLDDEDVNWHNDSQYKCQCES